MLPLPDAHELQDEGSGVDGLTPEALEGAIQAATERGETVERTDDTTLLLDLDSAAAYAQYQRVFAIFDEHFDVLYTEEWRSKSGKNMHVKITLANPQPLAIRFALQAAMGSDGVKEVLSLIQHLKYGCEEPSILFRPTIQEIKK